MRKQRLNKLGFGVIEALVIVALLAVIGFVGYTVINNSDSDDDTKDSSQTEKKKDLVTAENPLGIDFDAATKTYKLTTESEGQERTDLYSPNGDFEGDLFSGNDFASGKVGQYSNYDGKWYVNIGESGWEPANSIGTQFEPYSVAYLESIIRGQSGPNVFDGLDQYYTDFLDQEATPGATKSDITFDGKVDCNTGTCRSYTLVNKQAATASNGLVADLTITITMLIDDDTNLPTLFKASSEAGDIKAEGTGTYDFDGDYRLEDPTQ